MRRVSHQNLGALIHPMPKLADRRLRIPTVPTTTSSASAQALQYVHFAHGNVGDCARAVLYWKKVRATCASIDAAARDAFL